MTYYKISIKTFVPNSENITLKDDNNNEILEKYYENEEDFKIVALTDKNGNIILDDNNKPYSETIKTIKKIEKYRTIIPTKIFNKEEIGYQVIDDNYNITYIDDNGNDFIFNNEENSYEIKIIDEKPEIKNFFII